jgi:tagatose 6-phosphate kinase
MADPTAPIICVSLNTALDRIFEVPDLVIGGHVRGRLLSIQPAGKAVNVARLLGTLGTPCVLTGFVGEGDRHRFARSFAKTGVRVEMFEGHGPTRENVTLIDPLRGHETHIRDVGFALMAGDLARLRKKLAILATPGAYVLFAGSLPPGLEADAFTALVAGCAERGARVAVDSSGPGLEPVRRIKGLWLAKPNRVELAELAGRKVETGSEVRAAAEALLERIAEVVVTRGEEGALLFTRAGAWRATPRIDPAEVVNTVGCGDALLAGFVQAHAGGASPEECLRRGVAVGTAKALKVRAGEVDLADVERVYATTEVKAFA